MCIILLVLVGSDVWESESVRVQSVSGRKVCVSKTEALGMPVFCVSESYQAEEIHTVIIKATF